MMTASSPEIRLAWTRAEARRVVGMLQGTPKEALEDQYWGDDGSPGRQHRTLQREGSVAGWQRSLVEGLSPAGKTRGVRYLAKSQSA